MARLYNALCSIPISCNCLQGYGGNSLGSRFIDLSSLFYLNQIDLVRCENLTSFPPLGNFHRLSHLQIESAKILVRMGYPDVQRSTNRSPANVSRTGRTAPPFTVIINDCQKLTSLNVYDFKVVQVFKITRCPQLQLICLQWLSSLLHLSIAESQQDIPSEFSYAQGFKSLDVLELEKLPNWESWRGPRWRECPMLRQFSIVDCPNASFCSETNLRGVQVLKIRRCPQLQESSILNRTSQERLPKNFISESCMRLGVTDDNYACTLSMSDPKNYPPSVRITILDHPKLTLSSVDSKALQILKIFACPEINLPCLGRLPSLQHLSVIQCDQDIPTDFSSGGFQQLETLELKHLPKWRSWAGPREGECSNLLKLSIVDCKRIGNFSMRHFESLKDTYIWRVISSIFRDNIEKFLGIKRYHVSDGIGLISHCYGYLDVAKVSICNLLVARSCFARLENFSSIQNLILFGCEMPLSLSDEELNQMASLEAIQLQRCKSIRRLRLHSQRLLKYVSVKDCYVLSSVECRSSVLRFLELHRSFKSHMVFNPLDGLLDLEYLSIRGCEIDETHWKQLSATLKVLEIHGNLRYPNTSLLAFRYINLNT